jgi:hypothetical protein
LYENGFALVKEKKWIRRARPDEKMLAQDPDWREELRRPRMLILSSERSEKA